jgi:four helix bundle protein
MQDFRNLNVWQAAHHLALTIFTITRDFDSAERYGLTSQIRRLCAAIPANIAGGCGYTDDTDFHQFCVTAMGRACALENYLILARDVGLMNDLDYERVEPDMIEVKKMLAGLIRKLQGDS